MTCTGTPPLPTCGECGAEADYSCVDVVQYVQDGQWISLPLGKAKHGCLAHLPETATYIVHDRKEAEEMARTWPPS